MDYEKKSPKETNYVIDRIGRPQCKKSEYTSQSHSPHRSTSHARSDKSPHWQQCVELLMRSQSPGKNSGKSLIYEDVAQLVLPQI